MGVRHVIWDWNGTLLDDFAVILDATNVSCRELLGVAVSEDDYRRHFTRPVQRFYERLLDRPITEDEWQRLNDGFHRSYTAGLVEASLAPGAEAALRRLRQAGVTQSILSLWVHDQLVDTVERLGIGDYFVLVDGRPEPSDGGVKRDHLIRHLDRLQAASGAGWGGDGALMIGDSLDDAHAAADAGLPCVLVEGGSHHREDLVTAGVPVASTLPEALALGGALGALG